MTTPMISVSDLTYTYSGRGAPAVKRLTFEVAAGEIFGFLGPSGAGKSTTQKILTRLLDGYSGSVRVGGRDLAGWGHDFYEWVGVSFERPSHYLKLTARENLACFRGLYAGATAEPLELLTLVGLAEDADKPVGQFSKGMMNRLNVARALLHRPRLLFLDEPTAGLDPVSAQRMRDLIRQQQRAGATVFLTTHDMAVADALCDRVAFIVAGEIKLIDAPRQLRLRHGRRSVRVEVGGNGRPQAHEFALAGLAENCSFLALLRDESLETIHTQETTLEDVFIAVTGTALTANS